MVMVSKFKLILGLISCLVIYTLIVGNHVSEITPRLESSLIPDQLDPPRKQLPHYQGDLQKKSKSEKRNRDDVKTSPSEDQLLLQEIRDKMNTPSPDHAIDTRNIHTSQANQSEYVDKVSGQLRNGFFVECGAGNGRSFSNSWFFEQTRNWTGLLVEANRRLFESILKLKRRAYSINACMSLTPEPTDIKFIEAGVLGGIDGTIDRPGFNNRSGNPMRCYPLHRMLQAIGQTHVNYFSLDVEGPELDILKTIPFDEIVIDFLTIEYRITSNRKAGVEKLHQIRDFLHGTGLYEQIAILDNEKSRTIYEGEAMAENEAKGLDVAFKRKDVVGYF